jgi:hypothetical protein
VSRQFGGIALAEFGEGTLLRAGGEYDALRRRRLQQKVCADQQRCSEQYKRQGGDQQVA